MSTPHPKPYSITVFVVEGIKAAVIVTSIAGRMRQRRQSFASPEAALAWCREHKAGMVYTPADDPTRN